MQRFILFSGSRFYPEGGALDYRGSFATIEEAKLAGEKLCEAKDVWANILDQADGSAHFTGAGFIPGWHRD